MALSRKSIRDLDLKGRRLFLRVDFNCPITEQQVGDATRIQAALPTIRYALDAGAKVILATHLGRPKGQRDERYSLRPVHARLEQVLGAPVAFASDCVGPAAAGPVAALKSGQAILLENLRFHAGEEKNQPDFSLQLARLADLYVNDAFGAAHRAHASTYGIVEILGGGCAGFLMERELEYLGRILQDPEKPMTAILGGAKVSDKIDVIENLIPLCDALLIGGAMSYTFLRARGMAIGKSLVEEDKVELAADLLTRSAEKGCRLELPIDHVVAREISATAETRVVPSAAIEPDWMGLDIGPRTVAAYRTQILSSRTVVWNGPMGVFEVGPFSTGTMQVAQAVARCDGLTVVGGGDSVAALNQAGVVGAISHISTGGGASLEFLAGKKLPGVEVLSPT